MSVSCSWGSVQEAAALLHLAAAFPHSQLAEVGLCRLQQHLLPPEWGFGPGSLPPIGASPDGLIRHTLHPGSSQAAGAGAAGAGAPASSSSSTTTTNGSAAAAPAQAAAAGAVGPWDIDGLLARLQLAGSGPAVPGSYGSDGSGGGGGGSSSHLVEVVELKHTSPFGHSRRWVGG